MEQGNVQRIITEAIEGIEILNLLTQKRAFVKLEKHVYVSTINYQK